jgi:hypothetical protein
MILVTRAWDGGAHAKIVAAINTHAAEQGNNLDGLGDMV